jgi:hypothetical protein
VSCPSERPWASSTDCVSASLSLGAFVVDFIDHALVPLVEAGDVTVDRDMVALCEARLASSCPRRDILAALIDDGTALPAFDPCTAIFHARCDDGTCWSAEDCRPAERCARPSDAPHCAPGSCAPAAARGDRCTSARDCARVGSDEGVACVEDRCTPYRIVPASDGSSCVPAVNGTVFEVPRCAANSVCFKGRCAPIPAVGETCLGLGLCGPGLLCAGGTCAHVDDALTSVPGAPCRNGCDHRERLVCQRGVCEPSDGIAGSPCSVYHPQCEPGLICLRAPAGSEPTFTCQRPAPPGARCVADVQCGSVCCDAARGSCI